MQAQYEPKASHKQERLQKKETTKPQDNNNNSNNKQVYGRWMKVVAVA